MKNCCKLVVCHAIIGSIGILLVIAGSLLIGLKVADEIVNTQVDKELVLSLSSSLLSQWINPKPPIYMQYWLFNVTNPENISRGEKPTVEEIGPFTYRLYQPKEDVAFFTNNTVMYKYDHTLVFQRNMSYSDVDLRITQLNVPLLVVETIITTLPSWVSTSWIHLVLKALDETELFVEHTVHEWLFGYPDPVFKLLHAFMKIIHVDIPSQFGFFFGYNNSYDGLYLADTGGRDVINANLIHRWNGEKSLSYWSSPEANMINGTDGLFMHPKVDSSQTLYIYSTDVCRSMYLKFANHTTVRGIKTLRFHLPAEVFANATINPENAGFCVPPENCFDSGVLNLGPCKQGAPVILSSPHFYLAADQYKNGVNGVHPVKEEHETFLDIEPMSGFLFAAMKRLQLNVHLKSSELVEQTKHVNEVILPTLWLNQSVALDASTADMFKSQVISLITTVHAIPYAVLGIGLFLVLIGAGLLLRKFLQEPKGELLLTTDESE